MTAAKSKPSVADIIASVGANSAKATGKAPGKNEAAKAERVTVRYKEYGQWQAVRVFNTAYYDKAELDFIIKRHVKALKDAGRKSVGTLRWTPTVFNATDLR